MTTVAAGRRSAYTSGLLLLRQVLTDASGLPVVVPPDLHGRAEVVLKSFH